jgi:hypothetical protein
MNQKTFAAFLVSLLALCTWMFGYILVAYTFHHPYFVTDIFVTDMWMLSDAIAKCLIIVVLLMLTTGYFHQWLMFVFSVAVNNLLDELWFDPYTLGLNEAAITVLLAVYYTTQINKALYAARRHQ